MELSKTASLHQRTRLKDKVQAFSVYHVISPQKLIYAVDSGGPKPIHDVICKAILVVT